MRFRDIEKIIKKVGWYEVAQVGSHHQYKNPTKKGKVTIPRAWRKRTSKINHKKHLKASGVIKTLLAYT